MEPSPLPADRQHSHDRRTPLFVEMSRPRQAWESVGGAAVTGAVCGLLLGFTWWAYLLGVAVSFIGGLPTGSQHRTLPGALARAFVGGSVWAAAVFITVGLLGRPPSIPLPETVLGFLPWGFLPACVFAAGSWLVGRRRRARSADRPPLAGA